MERLTSLKRNYIYNDNVITWFSEEYCSNGKRLNRIKIWTQSDLYTDYVIII